MSKYARLIKYASDSKLAAEGGMMGAGVSRAAQPARAPEPASQMNIVPKRQPALAKGAALSGDEILNMDSMSGRAADYLTPTHRWGGRRAGRATAMGDAAGADVPLNVRHPMTASLPVTLPAALLGSVAGGFLGKGLTADPAIAGNAHLKHYENMFSSGALSSPEALKEFKETGDKLRGEAVAAIRNRTGATALGSFGGSLALGGGAAILMAALRRRQMRKIKEQYDASRQAGTLQPEAPRFSTAATLLAPLRGSHRKGMMQGYNAIKNDVKPQNSTLSTAGYVLGDGALTGAYENVSAHGAARQAQDVEKAERAPKPKKKEDSKPAEKKEDGKKEASFWQHVDKLLKAAR